MLPTLLRRTVESAQKQVPKKLPVHLVNNAHQARKVWPPDFSVLNAQQQLRFEKKYKRRLRVAAYSPRWDRGVRYAQLATIAAALVWLFFYAEFEWWGRQYKPYDEMRKHAKNVLGVEFGKEPYKYRKEGTEPEPEPEPAPLKKGSGSS